MAPEAIGFNCVPKMNPEDNPVNAAVSSLGIKEGRESESEVVITDMLRKRIHEQMAEMEYNGSRAWAHAHMLAVMKINE